MNNSYEVLELVRQMGIKKYHTPLPKLILLGLLAGVYVAMGGVTSTFAASGVDGWAASNPILPKLLAGATFPLGLLLVVLVGAELFTGNTAYLVPATMRGDIPRSYWIKNWLIVYLANFTGACLFSYFLVYQTQILNYPEKLHYLFHLVEHKLELSFAEAFWRGVGANWFVCLAVWLGLSSKTMSGRVMGLWFPVMAFVLLGFEHSIANMFYVPTAIFYGADIAWGDFLLNNLLPSTLGNIVGGALCVGTCYSYLYCDTHKKP